MRVPIELEAIAGLEPDIDGRHEIFPGFEHALRIGMADVFILKELLANPAKGTVLGRTRLVGAEGLGAASARSRKKSKQRFQRDAELVHARIAIEQVVWVVGTESPTDLAAGTNIALRGSSPRAKLQV